MVVDPWLEDTVLRSFSSVDRRTSTTKVVGTRR